MTWQLTHMECVAKEPRSHLAFTDLICYQGTLYLTYRQGSTHHHQDGVIVVLKQLGGQWQEQARLHQTGDLRDPKFSITPQGKLWLNCACVHEQMVYSICYELDNNLWQEPMRLGEPGDWLWRIVWYDGWGYSLAYQRPNRLRVYRIAPTGDSYIYQQQPLEKAWCDYPNEAGLLLRNAHQLCCLLRRDGSTDSTALWGTCDMRQASWQWHKVPTRIGGPVITQAGNHSLLAVVRLYEPARTSLCRLDEPQNILQEIVQLPSGGDTSYAGVVWKNEQQLLISYYSSHEGPTAIYLAEVSDLPA